jgi:hypothetical protein
MTKLPPFSKDELNRRIWEIAVSNPIMDLAKEIHEKGVEVPLSLAMDPRIPAALKNKIENYARDAAVGASTSVP